MKCWLRKDLAVLCTLILAGIAANPALAFDDKDRAAIRAVQDAWLKAAGVRDTKALAALYNEDAVLMPPNSAAITGREAIAAFFNSFPPFKDLVLNQVEVDGDGNIAFARGSYSMTIVIDDKTSIAEKGKFLEVWRKQKDGTWKIARDMFSSDLPMPGADDGHGHAGHQH